MEVRGRDRKVNNTGSVLLWIAIFLANASFGYAVMDKCSACNAIADEIQIGLSNEKPKNHLDMRHRLDSKGQREGKVIDYRESELRVVELLEGLCEKMQDHTLEKAKRRALALLVKLLLNTGEEIWVRVDDWDSLPAGKDKQEARAYSKYISSFCARLLEETEDELAELIKRSDLKAGQISKSICQKISKYCEPDSEDDDYTDDEL